MKHDPLEKYFESADLTKAISDGDLDRRFSTQDLLARLRAAAPVKPAWKIRPWLWHRTTIISLAAVLVIAGTATAITLLRSSVVNTSRLSCYSQVSLTANVIDVVPLSKHPLQSCDTALNWKHLPESPSPNGSLCILSNGSLAGFPPTERSGVCARLKLAAFDGKLESLRVAYFEKAAVTYFGESSCIPPDVARAKVVQLLAEFHLKHWQVEITRSSSDRACATLALRVKARVVLVVGFLK